MSHLEYPRGDETSKLSFIPPNPGFAHTKKQHIQTIWYTYHQRMHENTGYIGSDFDFGFLGFRVLILGLGF